MVKKKLSKEDKLEALRAKLAGTDTGGGSGKNFFSVKEGTSRIRILPEVGDMSFFFQEVGRHYIRKDNNDKILIYCPSFTFGGEHECPVCEIVNDLYRSGDSTAKELAGELRVSKQYWMNVIDRKNEEAGPQIFTPGVGIFNSIISYINDPDYGDITDEEHGTDIIVERKGTGFDTEYQTRAVRSESPLSDDDELIDEWYDKAYNLAAVMLSEDSEEDKELIGDSVVWVLPYDRINDEFDLDELIYGVGSDDDDDDDDDDEFDVEEAETEEVHPVKRDVSERKARRRSRTRRARR